MTSVLDATSTSLHASRSFDAVLADLRDVVTWALDRHERAALLDAVAAIEEHWRACADSDVDRILLDAAPAGTGLAQLVFDTDPALLDPDAQVSYVQACERLANAAHARRDAGIATFAGANPVHTRYWVNGDEHALTDVRALELQAALHWGQGFTRTRIDTARALALLPETRTAFAQGLASQRTVDAITQGAITLTEPIDATIRQHAPEQTEHLRDLRQQMLTEFDEKLAHFATEHNPLNVQGKIRNTIVRLDPAGAASRRAIAVRAQSDVEYRTLADGLAQIIATMAAEQALACMRTVDAVARATRDAGPSHPIGLHRANAFATLLTGTTHARVSLAVGATSTPAAQAVGETVDHASTCDADVATVRGSNFGVHLDVVMDLNTFLGLNSAAAEVVGAGPLTAHATRALLADAAYVKLRRVITDPITGHRLDTGVRRYMLTQAEQARIFARDRFCRFPDCTRPACNCECDHALPYDQGGPSSTANLGALCKAHHQHKTHAGWHIAISNADGSCEWASPLGRRYAHAAEPLLPWIVDEQQVHVRAPEAAPPESHAREGDDDPPF